MHPIINQLIWSLPYFEKRRSHSLAYRCGAPFSKPNEVIYAYFLYMETAENSELKYIIIMREDLSSHVWLRKKKPHS